MPLAHCCGVPSEAGTIANMICGDVYGTACEDMIKL